jgi:3-deoxy-D-manno-octulosonic-acid transferase
VRLVYLLLIYLLAPIVIAMEGWRAIWNPEYRGRLRQRLGFIEPQAVPGSIWFHAVSVGEVQASAALVRALRSRHPEMQFVITTVTPTGAQQVKSLFGDSVRHCYLPYDLPGSVHRFLDRIRPRVAIILETEIWPTLYAALGRRQIPLVLASARVSTKSVDRYRRMASLFTETLSHGIVIGAQSEADARRFRAIGAPRERVIVTGNVKLDLQIPGPAIRSGQEFRERCGRARPVWIAGSTHDGEEEAVLESHEAVRRKHPDALLILVPRHPQRFDGVRTLLRRNGMRHTLRSEGQMPTADTEVFLVDTLGELQMFYSASDVAFVAGSLVPIGGHNVLEPAVLGIPILVGPHNFNAQEIADLLQQAGALKVVRSSRELAQRVTEYFDDPSLARQDGELGRAAVEQSRGAVARLVALVSPLISPAASAVARSWESSGNR